MSFTTLHIPDRLLPQIDKIVKEKKISRNRFIIQACEQALKSSAGEWPESFFEPYLNAKDLSLLREGVLELETAIMNMRRNRRDIGL